MNQALEEKVLLVLVAECTSLAQHYCHSYQRGAFLPHMDSVLTLSWQTMGPPSQATFFQAFMEKNGIHHTVPTCLKWTGKACSGKTKRWSEEDVCWLICHSASSFLVPVSHNRWPVPSRDIDREKIQIAPGSSTSAGLHCRSGCPWVNWHYWRTEEDKENVQ